MEYSIEVPQKIKNRSMIYFEIIFTYGVRSEWFLIFFLYEYQVVPETFLEKILFPR